jgi:hypothetical protein
MKRFHADEQRRESLFKRHGSEIRTGCLSSCGKPSGRQYEANAGESRPKWEPLSFAIASQSNFQSKSLLPARFTVWAGSSGGAVSMNSRFPRTLSCGR